jgi:hypothetical protein
MYSLYGEVGYALWGDRASGPDNIKGISSDVGFPFRSLVDRYANALLIKSEAEGGGTTLVLKGIDEARPVFKTQERGVANYRHHYCACLLMQ